MFLTSTGLLFALVIVFDKQIMCDLKVCFLVTLSACFSTEIVSSGLLYHCGFMHMHRKKFCMRM